MVSGCRCVQTVPLSVALISLRTVRQGRATLSRISRPFPPSTTVT
ncbi:hypothetical protein [Phage toucan80]|nr:hypothetical protein [Phage toucan80]